MTRPTPADFMGSAVAMVQALPLSMALGVLVFAPLGPAVALSMGVQAGLVALLVGGALAQWGGAPMSVSSPRAAGMVVLSGMVAFLARTQPDMSLQAVALAVAICLVVSGLLQLVMALSRVDRLLERLPEPVLGGFTLVIGMLIVLDQLNPLLLGQYARRPDVLDLPGLLALAQGPAPAVGLGVLALVVALGGLPKRWPKGRVPAWAARLARLAPLVGLLVGTLAVWLLNAWAQANTGTSVPTLAQALPGFDPAQRSWWPPMFQPPGWGAAVLELGRLDSVGWLLAPAALIAVIHSLDAMSTARMLRADFGVDYRARRELLAQGVANIGCGLSGGIGVTATPSLSRALVSAGASSRWGRLLFTAWLVLCVWKLWGVVALVAVPVLGALVASTGVQMFTTNWHHLQPRRLSLDAASLNQNLGTGIVWLMLGLALFTPMSVLWIVGVGLGLTVMVWVHQASSKLVFRQYSGLHRRSLEQRSPANDDRLQATGDQVQVIEMEGDLFFGTAPLLRDHLLAAYPQGAPTTGAHHLVLDFSRLDQMDASGLNCLESLLPILCNQRGVTVWLSYVPQHPSLAEHLKHSRVDRSVPRERWLPDTESALEAIEDELLADHSKEYEGSVQPQDTLCGTLSQGDWHTFHQACQPVALAAAEVLYQPGDAAACVYWLQQGDMRLMLPPLRVQPADTPQGARVDERRYRAKRLAALNPGTWLGLDALRSDAQRSASAVAHRPSQLLALSVVDLQGWARSHPALAAAVFSSLAVDATERLAAAARELVVVDA